MRSVGAFRSALAILGSRSEFAGVLIVAFYTFTHEREYASGRRGHRHRRSEPVLAQLSDA